jgi:prepilin-type N-terminal cleavage/methylation domain-containing protein
LYKKEKNMRNLFGKKGFTLIDLLIAVLIIGVLAAVALPRYQTAINKSRYAGLMPVAKAVKDTEEEVFMTKNDYTADLEELSVKVPGTINPANTATDGKITVQVVAGASAGQDYVKAVDNRNTDNVFVMYFDKSPRYPGEIHCEALTASEKAQQLCKSSGGGNTVTGTDGDYTTYVVEGTGNDAGPLGGGGPGINLENILAEIAELPHDGRTRQYMGETCSKVQTPGGSAPTNNCKSTYKGNSNYCSSNYMYGCAGSSFSSYYGGSSCMAGSSWSADVPDYACAGSSFTGSGVRCYADSVYGCVGSSFGNSSYCSARQAWGCYGSTFSGTGTYCTSTAENGCAGTTIQTGAYCEGQGCADATYEGTGCCKGDYCGSAPMCP